MFLYITISILALCGLFVLLRMSALSKKMLNHGDAEVPEHIWDELKAAIPEPDYKFLRSTREYMGSSPRDLLARLNYIGAVHNPDDPMQVRLAILELRIADQEKIVEKIRLSTHSDVTIMWLSVISVSGVSSFIAFVFFLLKQTGVPLE